METLLLLIALVSTAHPVDTLADRYFDARMAAAPELPYFVGLEADRHDGLSDNSPDALRAWEQTEDMLYGELSQVDAASLAGTPQWITHGILKELLEASIDLRVCHRELWNVNHMGGWHARYGRLASYQPVGTPDLRAQSLARWGRFPDLIVQEIANLKAGLAAGYSSPKPVVEKVIRQVTGVIELPTDTSPFHSPAKRDGDDAFTEASLALIEGAIVPALTRYRDFLRDEYLPKAREALSVTANPSGKACYEASLRSYTTLPRSGQAVFELGQQTVAANRERVEALGQSQYGLGDFEAILARAADDPSEKFTSKEALLDASRSFVAGAQAVMPRWFNTPPPQPVIVEPYPDYQDGTGVSSRYESPAPGRPGVYRITLHSPTEQSRGDAEVVAIHEAWPGHHLQIAIAQRVEGVHKVSRIAFNSGYTEGWARYAEALGEEMGLYQTTSAPIVRRAWPARGMVADPGLHLFGWTREQVRDYILESRRMGVTRATDAADRIAILPGQLTAYDSGALEIFALREAAEEALGERFDIREFHDRVLENGVIPLPMLRTHVEAWIEEASATK